MERLLAGIVGRPYVSLGLTLVVTAALAVGVGRLKLRTDGAAIYPEDNPVVIRSEADRALFNDPQQIILLVSSDAQGPLLATPDGFRYVKRLHQSVREVPGVYGDGVRSIASLLDIETNVETMVISGYLDSIPDDIAAFSELTERIRQAPLGTGLFLSEDGQLAALYVPFAESSDRQQVLANLDRWLDGHKDPRFRLRLMGMAVAEATLGNIVLRDLAVLIPVMVAVVALMLLATLRTVGGLIIPLMEALLVLVWTLGLMGWVGAPVTLVTTILPVILMTMAITDEIHLLQRLQARLAEAKPKSASASSDQQRLRQVTVLALRDVARPIAITSVTTAIGFLSFLSASMTPMRHFGVFTAIGILTAMVLSFTAIPGLIVLLPHTWFRRLKGSGGRRSQPLLTWAERRVVDKTGTALLVGLGILVVCAPGLLWLRVQDSWIDNFDKRSPIVSAERDFNDGFWGSYRFDVVFEGPPGMFYETEGARLMEEFASLVREGPYVGGVVSYRDVFANVAKGLGEASQLSELTDGKLRDIATLVQMVGDPRQLAQLMTDDGGVARATILVNSPDYRRSEELNEYVGRIRQSIESEYNVSSHSSGDIPVALEVVQSIVVNQLRSISWTLLGIAVLLLITFPRGVAALVAMIPVTSTALAILAVMGYAGIPLGIASSMFASLTVGVGVDFALHVIHSYKRERHAGSDHRKALSSTLLHTGQAIRWNATVLILGFTALTFSNLKPDRDLGILLAVAVATCYTMTLLLLPQFLRRLALVLVLLTALTAGRSEAATVDSSASDPSAWALMRQLELDFRAQARVAKIDFSTAYAGQNRVPITRTVYGVVNGDTSDTRILWVVTEPSRMAGTTLLFADKADTSAADSTWLYLSAIKRVRFVDIRSARALVPGTALTYEDSRGFVPVDKYHFRPAENATEETPGQKVLTAQPVTEEIRLGVGFHAMLLQIDPDRRLLIGIDYLDGQGDVFKTYRLEESVDIGGTWFPTRVLVSNLLTGATSTATYDYWLLDEPPADSLFDPSLTSGMFHDRIKRLISGAGIDRSAPVSGDK